MPAPCPDLDLALDLARLRADTREYELMRARVPFAAVSEARGPLLCLHACCLVFFDVGGLGFGDLATGDWRPPKTKNKTSKFELPNCQISHHSKHC
jgi:hypothetical protein